MRFSGTNGSGNGMAGANLIFGGMGSILLK